ncbi:hypothetical protein ACFLRZ_05045, partial [Bacteroidota bacterium]
LDSNRVEITKKNNDNTVKVEVSVNSTYENFDKKIKELSIKEWPDDFEMQLDFITRQKIALEKLNYNRPVDVCTRDFNKIRMNAKKEWPDDFEMQLDYEQRQIESIRRIRDMK